MKIQVRKLLEHIQALMRFVVFYACHWRIEYHAYAKPTDVGWYGWYEMPGFGLVAFEGLDGKRCYTW